MDTNVKTQTKKKVIVKKKVKKSNDNILNNVDDANEIVNKSKPTVENVIDAETKNTEQPVNSPELSHAENKDNSDKPKKKKKIKIVSKKKKTSQVESDDTIKSEINKQSVETIDKSNNVQVILSTRDNTNIHQLDTVDKQIVDPALATVKDKIKNMESKIKQKSGVDSSIFEVKQLSNTDVYDIDKIVEEETMEVPICNVPYEYPTEKQYVYTRQTTERYIPHGDQWINDPEQRDDDVSSDDIKRRTEILRDLQNRTYTVQGSPE